MTRLLHAPNKSARFQATGLVFHHRSSDCEAGHTHPIGKSIFIFAGGTRHSFDKFAEPMNLAEGDPKRLAFAAAKGPDFASLLQRREKMLLYGKTMHIDGGVLPALLTVPAYRHGVHSMEALLAMSHLAGYTQLQRAALPPDAQLNLHADPDDFAERMRGSQLHHDLRRALAPLIHDAYRTKRLGIEKDGMQEIAEAAGCSVRSLQLAFSQFRDATPIVALRRIRLEAVRQVLDSGEARGTVTDVAYQYGFTNTDRFSRVYKQTFGVSPVDVLRRNHSGPTG